MVWRRSLTVVAVAAGLAGALLLPGGCGLIDEDRTDCPEEITLKYSLDLITNKDQELDEKLGTEKDLPIRMALEDYIEGIFVDKAHDVDLSFYDLRKGGQRNERRQEIMDATRREYEVRVKASDYMHLGVANLSNNGQLILTDDEKAEESLLKIDALAAETVPSMTTGVFTARKRMLVRKDEDNQVFEAHLYMMNDAAALVLNVDSCEFRSIRCEYAGLADRFRINDSTYAYDRLIKVHADQIDVEPYLPRVSGNGPSYYWAYDGYWTMWTRTPVLFCGVGLPSPNVGTAVIGTSAVIWRIILYVDLMDGTTTRNEIYIGEPLPASSLKIIKGWLLADGTFTAIPAVPINPTPTPGPDGPYPPTPPVPPDYVDAVVGVDVTLNWKEGPGFEPEL